MPQSYQQGETRVTSGNGRRWVEISQTEPLYCGDRNDHNRHAQPLAGSETLIEQNQSCNGRYRRFGRSSNTNDA